MANVFQTVDWMADTSLFWIKNSLAVASNFNTDPTDEFKKPFAVGSSIRIKKPWKPTVTSGLPYNPQAIIRIPVTVNLDQVFGIHFEWDSYEKAVSMERGEKQLEAEYIKPAMQMLAQEIDSRAANWARLHANNIVGILGTDPTTFDATSAAARQRLVELGGASDASDKCMVVPPNVMRALKNSSIAYFNPVADLTKQWRTGIVGSGDGFEWYESVSLYSHTAGSLTATPTVKTTSVDGDTTLAITCTTGDTLNDGDVISVASCNQVNPLTRRKVTSVNKPFVIRGNYTAAANTITATISPTIYGPGNPYQNVDALPVAGSTITLFPGTSSPNGKAGINGIAFTRNAFAMVGVPMEIPEAAEVSWVRQDPETGLAISFLRMMDPKSRTMVNRFDVLMGFGDLYSDECAVRVLGA